MAKSSNRENSPTLLYKIVSPTQWLQSQENTKVALGEIDTSFIHLATKEQVDKVLNKFWSNQPEVVILTLDVKKLQGHLVKERNPGGQTEYYHLYDGSIPLIAVVDIKVSCAPYLHKIS